MKDYKYTARFESIASCLIDEEADRFLAKASLDNLKPLLPKNVDWEAGVDLLPVVANGTVINRANKNGHLITHEKAIEVARNSQYRFVDVEHNRSNICGVIVSAGFSKFGNSELLSEDEIKDKKEPFQMSLAAAIWKVARPKLIKKIVESSDPESEWYQKISFSWEIGFSQYQILRGSKNLIDGELITDPDKIKELSAHLMHKDKDGKESRMGWGKMKDGVPIYTVISGENVILLGYGLTLNPAADVRGLLTVGDNITLTEEDDEENDDASVTTTSNATNVIITLESDTDKALREINETLKLSAADLQAFSADLFFIAKDAEQSFETVSKAVLEFSRQGLSLQETTKRTKDAMILIRVSGLEVEKAVAGLTNIITQFKGSLSSTDIINRLAKVDYQFDMSAKDLVDSFNQIEKNIVAAAPLENPPATSENEPKPLVTETVASENTISHKNNPCVKEGNMKIVSKEDLRAKLLEAKVGEEVIASAVTYFNDELDKAGKAYEAEKSAKDLALSEVKAQAEKTKTDLAAVQTQLETANKALIELQAAKAQKEKDDAFQTRMAGLDSEYDFDADLKKVVASQIKDLDEAGYKNWFDGFKVIASAKKKGAAPAKTEVAAVLDPKVIAEQALANATVVSTPIPNAATTTASIKDKYKLSKEDYQVK